MTKKQHCFVLDQSVERYRNALEALNVSVIEQLNHTQDVVHLDCEGERELKSRLFGRILVSGPRCRVEARQKDWNFDLITVPGDSELAVHPDPEAVVQSVVRAVEAWLHDYQPLSKDTIWRLDISADGSVRDRELLVTQRLTFFLDLEVNGRQDRRNCEAFVECEIAGARYKALRVDPCFVWFDRRKVSGAELSPEQRESVEGEAVRSVEKWTYRPFRELEAYLDQLGANMSPRESTQSFLEGLRRPAYRQRMVDSGFEVIYECQIARSEMLLLDQNAFPGFPAFESLEERQNWEIETFRKAGITAGIMAKYGEAAFEEEFKRYSAPERLAAIRRKHVE
jgi:hypothetical protein